MQADRIEGMTIGTSASLLGVPEFSLLARVQSGELEMRRARSGEVLISEADLERLAGGPIETQAGRESPPRLPDERLGIQKRNGGLRRNGETVSFRVPGFAGGFTEREINGYRAAFSAIAGQLESVKDLKEQLAQSGQVVPASGDFEINTPQTGRWEVRSTLLKLGGSEVLFCQRSDDEFAIIERFQKDSRYARANGHAEILLQGNDARQLLEDFNNNAQLSLELMASNLVAKAQKIVWEQFPDERPGHIIAAISERCRQAASNQEILAENIGQKNTWNRGVRI